jgi:alpha-1,3-mannosyltransferase
MARAEKRRAASTTSAAAETEMQARSTDHRRALYFAAFLVLTDAALVALIIAFVPCL